MRTLLVLLAASLFLPAWVCAEEGTEVDPLAELAALGSALATTEVEGGGSIRAKKEADVTALKDLNAPENFEGRVEEVKTGTFPAVALKLRVTRPSQAGSSKSLARNAELVIIPKLKIRSDKSIDLSDPATVANAGAYYLKKGDKVMVRLGSQAGKTHWAEFIQRK